ncbi:MAG: GAF domain-containing protein [Acidimicrobiales bacterium]
MVVLVLAVIAVTIVIGVVVVERYRTARLSDIDIDSCLRNVARLDALAATGLMDAPPNSELDALTSEAAQRLRAPMAIMSLLDERRAFFASAHGLDGEIAVRRENPVHHSYCKYVVALDEPLKVNDSRRHRLVKDHPATLNGTRSYLGVPIRTQSGHTIGSFCVVDTVARHWTEGDLHILKNIGDRAMARVTS